MATVTPLPREISHARRTPTASKISGWFLMYDGEFSEHFPSPESAGAVGVGEGDAVGVGRTLGVGTGSACAGAGPNAPPAPASSEGVRGATRAASVRPAIRDAPTRPRPSARDLARMRLTTAPLR